MRVAALDLGTNTFRLLIADVNGSEIKALVREQIITRLGGGFDSEENLLSEPAIGRALDALKRFSQAIKKHKPEKVRATATEIVRRAENGGDFVKAAKRKTGIKIEVIPAEEEAALAFSGINAYIPANMEGGFVTLDIGGGSTEWTAGERGRLFGWVSLPLGVVALSEQIITGDPPTEASLDCAERQIWEALEGVPQSLDLKPPVDVVVGTGGTATSLAVLDMDMKTYDIDRVQNYRISTHRVEELERRLKALTFKERADLFPLAGGREDVIIPGAIITRVTLKRFGAKELVVSDAGLLEGLLLATVSQSE